MSEFNISQLPCKFEELSHTFKMVFCYPSLKTAVKDKFLVGYFEDEQFATSEQGRYLIYLKEYWMKK